MLQRSKVHANLPHENATTNATTTSYSQMKPEGLLTPLGNEEAVRVSVSFSCSCPHGLTQHLQAQDRPFFVPPMQPRLERPRLSDVRCSRPRRLRLPPSKKARPNEPGFKTVEASARADALKHLCCSLRNVPSGTGCLALACRTGASAGEKKLSLRPCINTVCEA